MIMKKFTEVFDINEAQSPETVRLGQIKSKIYHKVRSLKARGADLATVAAAEQELAEATAAYNASKAADRAGGNSFKASSKDYDEGYAAAVEAIKQAMSGNGSGQGSGSASGSGQNSSGLAPIPQPSKGNGSGNSANAANNSDMEQAAGDAKRSRNGAKDGQGVVRPEDCVGPNGSELTKVPGNAGGMLSKATGDKIAEAEGYDKKGGSEDAIASDWAERAKKVSKQIGNKPGYDKLKAKFDALYKTTKDWKKELKKVVGNAITPEDPRQAYANKNILISQDRIARTGKDKYDSMSFMMAAVDTSGSMTQKDLNICLNEVYQVALAKKPIKLVIVQFDTRIVDIQEFKSLAEFKRSMPKYQIKGGGGTEVKPVWDLLKKDPKYNRIPADILMVFTDGYLSQYKRDPKHMKNLCWVVIDNTSFDLQYKDINTKCIRILKKDMAQ